MATSTQDAQQLVAQARRLEEQGQFDAAVQAYGRAGAIEDAARVLFNQKRPDEAGLLLLRSLRVDVSRGEVDAGAMEALDPDAKKRALKAAICLTRGSQIDLGVGVFVALGEVARAAEVLTKLGDTVKAQRLLAEQARKATPAKTALGTPATAVPAPAPAPAPAGAAGRAPAGGAAFDAARRLEADGKHQLALDAYLQARQPGHAARMARMVRQPRQAAQLFSDAGMPLESAMCWLEVGDNGRALDQFTRVPRDDARYREAAIQAIKVATSVNQLDFSLENFLSSFLRESPTNEREADAFYLLAQLYIRQDFVENARDALAKIVAVQPRFRDAKALIARLDGSVRGSAKDYEKILREEEAFRAVGSDDRKKGGYLSDMANLPDLPDLPDLPPAPGLATIAGHAKRPAPAPEPAAPAPRVAAQPRAVAATRVSDAMPALVVPPSGRPSSTPPKAAPPDASAGGATVAPVGGSAPGTLGGRLSNGGTIMDNQAPGWSGFKEGSILATRYRLEKKLGEGGMASVYKAHDLELGEDVAIKVFTQTVEDDNMIARFKQELTLSRKLNHPNVIRLYDIGSFLGLRFISMELLEGRDLNHYMGTPIDLARGLDWLIQSCRGLEAAHQRGVVHRDIKPHNIFVCNDGVVKVMDFGIAKKQEGTGMTVGNMIAGTPDYMSPEQIAGFSTVTASTDIYAIGVTAYQTFTGRLPFEHPDLLPLLMKHLNEAPRPPREHNAGIPVALEQVILKLIEKRPEDRYATCGEVADAFDQVRRGLKR